MIAIVHVWTVLAALAAWGTAWNTSGTLEGQFIRTIEADQLLKAPVAPMAKLYSTVDEGSLTVIESASTIPSPTSTTVYGNSTFARTTTHTRFETIPPSTYTSTIWYNSSSTLVSAVKTIIVPQVVETFKVTSTLSSIIPISTTITSDVPSLTYVPSTTITPPPNPCPTTCTISAGTVNLFYWPSNASYNYPTTYFDSHLDYVFTSPSVYMVVNTIYGYNTAGRTGPSGTSVIFPLDLDEVSTIVPYESGTRQLTLGDLGTNCPQSEEPSVIKTAAPDGYCDPVLVAPEKVKSWASPCNACGNFGLFDPPYAVPPLTGGLVPETTTTTQAEPQTTASATTATETSQASSTWTETETSVLSTVSQATSTLTSAETSQSSTVPISSYRSTGSSSTITPGSSSTPVYSGSTVETPSSVVLAVLGLSVLLNLF